MNVPVFLRPILSVLALLTVAACSAPSPTAPTAPPLPKVVTLTVAGLPTSVAYRQSAQLTAIGTLEGGAQTQTLDAAWQSSDTTIATVSTSGLLTVVGFGDADVTATFENLRAAVHVALEKPAAPSAHLNVIVDNRGSWAAVSDAHAVVFDMSRSTGLGLRYDIAFGDGSSSSSNSAPVATHVYQAPSYYPAYYEARATVTDVLGQTATATVTVPVVALGHNPGMGWNDVDSPKGESHTIIIVTENGSKFTGWYDWRYLASQTQSRMTGFLDADGNVHVRTDDGTFALDGPVIVSAPWQRHMRLTVHGGPLDGKVLEFEFHPGTAN